MHSTQMHRERERETLGLCEYGMMTKSSFHVSSFPFSPSSSSLIKRHMHELSMSNSMLISLLTGWEYARPLSLPITSSHHRSNKLIRRKNNSKLNCTRRVEMQMNKQTTRTRDIARIQVIKRVRSWGACCLPSLKCSRSHSRVIGIHCNQLLRASITSSSSQCICVQALDSSDKFIFRTICLPTKQVTSHTYVHQTPVGQLRSHRYNCSVDCPQVYIDEVAVVSSFQVLSTPILAFYFDAAMIAICRNVWMRRVWAIFCAVPIKIERGWAEWERNSSNFWIAGQMGEKNTNE